jgi:hypothetical protein
MHFACTTTNVVVKNMVHADNTFRLHYYKCRGNPAALELTGGSLAVSQAVQICPASCLLNRALCHKKSIWLCRIVPQAV